MLLAQAMPPSVEVAGFLGCLFFLAAGSNQVIKLVASLKEKPSATEVKEQAHELFAKNERLDEHIAADVQTHSALQAQIKAVDQDVKIFRQEVQNNGETRRKSIEGKLETSHSQLFTLISKQNETMQSLAIGQAAVNATLAAWKEAPPWKPRA